MSGLDRAAPAKINEPTVKYSGIPIPILETNSLMSEVVDKNDGGGFGKSEGKLLSGTMAYPIVVLPRIALSPLLAHELYFLKCTWLGVCVSYSLT